MACVWESYQLPDPTTVTLCFLAQGVSEAMVDRRPPPMAMDLGLGGLREQASDLKGTWNLENERRCVGAEARRINKGINE